MRVVVTKSLERVEVVLLKGQGNVTLRSTLDKLLIIIWQYKTPSSLGSNFTRVILGIWNVDTPNLFVKMTMETCIWISWRLITLNKLGSKIEIYRSSLIFFCINIVPKLCFLWSTFLAQRTWPYVEVEPQTNQCLRNKSTSIIIGRQSEVHKESMSSNGSHENCVDSMHITIWIKTFYLYCILPNMNYCEL